MKPIYKIMFCVLFFCSTTSNSRAQFLSLSWPLNKSVIQQSGDNATVYVAGQLVGCPDSYDRLQMRIEKLDKNGSYSSLIQDYTDISRDNGGLGLFYEQPYLGKGWYHIIVKAINSGGSIVAINDVKVGVGNIFIIAGQSNASGIVESGGVPPLLPTDAAYDCVVTNDWLGNCDWKTTPSPAYIPYPLFPIFSTIASSGKIAPNGYNKWAYVKLGNSQVDGTNAPVALFNVGSHTTDIAAWKTSSDGGSVSGMPYIGWPCSGTMPANSGLPYKRLQQSLNYYGGLFGTRGILWHQGEAETEHIVATPSYNSDYTNKLNYIINKSRAQYGYTVPWFVSTYATRIGKIISGSWNYNKVNPTVQANQVTVAASNNTGAYTDNIDETYRHPNDYTHLNENSSKKGLTALANTWNTNMGYSGSGIAAQTVPSISLSYNSSTDVYTAYAPSGYSDYKWVTGNGDLDRGTGAGSSGYSMALAGAGVRCWVKNSSGNWSLTPLVYAQSCRSGARKGVIEKPSEQSIDTEAIYNLTVYPNPGNDQVQVSFILPQPSLVAVNIIDQNGRTLQSIVNNQHAQGSFTYQANVSSLPEGTYLCQLKANDISIVKRVVVKK